jgi:hypothetical protein
MMNKRTFLILALVAALALPTAAMAAAEFSLGGFIKLDAFWDSTQEGKNMNAAIVRNNNTAPTAASLGNRSEFQHGKVRFTSQGSRFNFTIKGPKLWGATTTGFIEMDFDSFEEGAVSSYAAGAAVTQRGGGTTTSNSYTPRLRHAMFRLNWPETELLFGQYWPFMAQWYPEVAQDGPMMMTGTPTARIPQIRLTQKFLGVWQVGALVGSANAITGSETYSLTDRAGGDSTEAPQVQVQAQFAQDLWGKAAWYGKPTPFTAQVNFGWQRSITQGEELARTLLVTGQSNYSTVAARTRHEYQDPWMAQANLFIPLIPTHSANLAGTAALQTTWWMGQGVEAFGMATFGSQLYRYSGRDNLGRLFYEVDLMSRWGGQVQAQYYFTNQWFLTGAWGFSKAFNVGAFQTSGQAATDLVTNGMANAFAADAVNYHQEYNLCLWYRPITAFKFGLQYAYNRTNYFQGVGQTVSQDNFTKYGEAHRVEFVGLFFF